MALTILPEISGQEVTSTCTYCYLYEPLRVVISENDVAAQQIFIELEIIKSDDDTVVVENLLEYGVFDLNPGQGLSVDLMKLARQHHNANVYNFSSLMDIYNDGWKSVISEYKYNFKITSDVTSTATSILKLPIIGGRDFRDFEPTLLSQPICTEADLDPEVDMTNVWEGWSFLRTRLQPATQQDAKPRIDIIESALGEYAGCGGQVVWKSRLGGWMTWGFKMKKENTSKQYQGNIQVGMFESTASANGDAYVPVDYTGIETSYTITLKQLGLTSAELKAVHGIIASPAVYYMREKTGELELMRLTSAQAPIDNKANGGDFTVSLKSISSVSQLTR